MLDDRIKLDQAIAVVLSFKENLPPDGPINENHVEYYNTQVLDIAEILQVNLDRFYIFSENLSKRVAYMAPGIKVPPLMTNQLYCDRHHFLLRMDGLLTFLKMQTNTEKKARAIGF